MKKIGINNNFKLLNTQGINPAMWIYIDCYGYTKDCVTCISKQEMNVRLVSARVKRMSRETVSNSIQKMIDMKVLTDAGDKYIISIPGRTFISIRVENARYLLERFEGRTILCYIWLKTMLDWKGKGFTFTLGDLARGMFGMEKGKQVSAYRYKTVGQSLEEIKKSGIDLRYHIKPVGKTFVRVLDNID